MVNVSKTVFLGFVLTSMGCLEHPMIGGSDWYTLEESPLTGLVAPEFELTAHDGDNGDDLIRVATWNLHFGTFPVEFVEIIQGDPELSKVDIFLTQEVDSYPAQGEDRARQLAAGLEMNYVYIPWFDKVRETRGLYGNAVFSRLPIRSVRVRELERRDFLEDEVNQAIAIEVEVNGKVIEVVCLHLDVQLSFGPRVIQADPVFQTVAQRAIVGGDLNTNPFIWSEFVPVTTSGALYDVDQAGDFDNYVRQYGFDTPTEESGPTWDGVTGPARLDHIYTRDVEPVGFGKVSDLPRSDHDVLWVEARVP